jgi:trigger factor
VEVLEVKEKILPPIDDELAKKYGAENMEKLRAGVRLDLENELKHSQRRAVRNQIIKALLDRVQFDLPETPVANVTRNVVYDIVRENTQRGVSRDLIEKQKDEIYSTAAASAKERVKFAFLVQRIVEKEKVAVSQEDVLRYAQTLAGMNQIPLDKFLKEVQKRNGVQELYDGVAQEKVLEFLESNAKIETVPAAK